MSYERETIWQIRSEINRYDKYHQLGGSVAIDLPPGVPEPRIFLCSEVRKSFTPSAYSAILAEDLGIKDFITPLSHLLQGRIGHNAKLYKVS